MDVFSLLKFWKLTSNGIDTSVRDYESSVDDDEDSFFELVITNKIDDFSDTDSNASFRFSSHGDVICENNNKRKTKIVKTPQSPLRALILGFQNKKIAKTFDEEKIEAEEVKISSLLKRDNSLSQKLRSESVLDRDQTQVSSKRFSKDVLNKYLNKMKPVKRSNEKSRFSENYVATPSSSPASSVYSPRNEQKRNSNGGGGRGTVFREVRKHLGKSRSASAILQTPAVTKADDSALEQQDSIKGAILHCKRSYNSSLQGVKVLTRSDSVPLNNNEPIQDEYTRSTI